MDGRNASKHRRMTHDFAFSGLIACGQCGCSMVGEIKKQRYVYTIAPDMPINAGVNLLPAVRSMSARKCWNGSSRPC